MTVFSVAPSVQYSERDATLHTKAEYNVTAAYVGVARWGKTGEPIQISDGEVDLEQKLFRPDTNTTLDFHIAADYLRYSSEIQYLRLAGDNAKNAAYDTGSSTNIPRVDSKEHFDTLAFPSTTQWVGRYVGSLGNALAVHVVDADTIDDSPLADSFEFSLEDGEYSVAILDTVGEITGGTPATDEVIKVRLTTVGDNIPVGDVTVLGTTTATDGTETSVSDLADDIIATLDGAGIGSSVKTVVQAGVSQVYSVEILKDADGDFSLELDVGGEVLTVAVTNGDTQLQIAEALRDAINGNANLQNYYVATAVAPALGQPQVVTITENFPSPTQDASDLIGAANAAGDDYFANRTIVTMGVRDIVDIDITMDYGVSHASKITSPNATAVMSVTETLVTASFIGTPITNETYELLQLKPNTKAPDGSNAYFYSVINNNSDFVHVISKDTLTAGSYKLEGGVDDYDVDRSAGYLELQNTEEYDTSIIIGHADEVREHQAAIDCALTRRDAIAFIAPLRDHVVGANGNQETNILDYRKNQLARDNSYFFMTDNWALIYDQYNDQDIWIPTCGGTAGLYARTIALEGPWKSPAFLNRGKYKSYSRLAWSAGATARKNLYKVGINSVVNKKTKGFVLWGDKTGLTRKSAFSRINVRGTFIMIEKNIADTAEYFLGENNNDFTRKLFANTVRPYLRDLEGRQAILEGRLKIDETNNTGQVIANNQMVAGIYIKPQFSINWIYLDFAALRPDMSFEEIEGQGIVAAD